MALRHKTDSIQYGTESQEEEYPVWCYVIRR